MFEGLDYAWAKTPEQLDCFAKNGISFICRYYAKGKSGKPFEKTLSRHEAKEISRRGMSIVPVWQTSATSKDYFSYERGLNDCRMAIDLAVATGQPPDSAIYFAVDFDARQPDLPALRTYFEAVAEAMEEYKSRNGKAWLPGVYGSHFVVSQVRRLVPQVIYGWQTYAWSYGQVLSDCNIYQYKNDVTFCDTNVDHDRSTGNHGGFRL